jgi:FMN phosphatase YigB (HAD superfamily)
VVRLAAVLLDVGGTLWPDQFPPGSDLRLERLSAAGLTSRQAQRFLDAFTPLASVAESGIEQDLRALIRDSARLADLNHPLALSLSKDPEPLRRALCLPTFGRFDLFPGARELLALIGELGLRCVIVSNASVRTGDDYRADFAAFGISDHVEAFVSSVDLGVRKPDLRIFEAALGHVQCAPREAVVVGNSERNDILPATRFGARSIRVAIEEPPPPASAAELVVTSLYDVAAALEAWAAAHSDA